MKKVLLLLLSLVLFSSLNASDLRKIVIGSYLSQKDADAALNKLNRYLDKNKEIAKYSDEEGFEFIARASGKYFIISAEPFRDRAVLNTVLNYIKKRHHDAFVNRIKDADLKKYNRKYKKKQSKELKKAKELEKIKLAEEEKAKKLAKAKELEKIKLAEEEKAKKVKVKKTEPQKIKKSTEPREKKSKNIFSTEKLLDTTLFYVLMGTVLFLLVAMVLIYLSRRENKLLVKKIKEKDDEIRYCQSTINHKEVFLAKVSHELRTPMNAIIGLSHIVLQTDLSNLQKENISKIKYSGELLLDIINDILDMSKMDAGELKIEKVELNINDVLDHVSNMVAINAKSKGLELIFDIDKDVPSHFIGDPLRLGQILINLLSNAIKFTKKGEIDLHVYKISQDNNKVYLEFKVSDTGIGMTSAQIAKLFKSFSQADDSTSRVYGGTGLGLSISKQLVELMGGGIRVESQYSRGSSFIFNIELELIDPGNKRHYRLPSRTFMGKRALIIDTNTKAISSLSKMLEYFQYSVQTMPVIEEAEAILNEFEFDILFIDEQKLSKYALEYIRKLKEKRKIKIVLIESLYNQGDNSTKRYDEIDKYLLKPFNQQSIFNIILELYGEHKSKITNKHKIIKDELKKLKNKNILVAEDNEINQRVLIGLLEGTDIKITIAENGKEVISELQKYPKYDLILMDISMPIMDGYEATQIIRKSHEYDDIPIIALTANSMESEIEHAISCGMQGFIGKPLRVEVFYAKLLEFLQKDAAIKELAQKENKKLDSISKLPIKKKTQNILQSLNYKEGIERCGEDKELYKALLQDFSEMYVDSVNVFKTIINEERYSDGRKFAHDIKGVSANIGATELASVAESLEKAFMKEDTGDYSLLIKNYQDSLKRILDDIKKIT